ncbi:MAG: site-specific integrase, partial [Planctomycetes bacterium]|nr:site-specific integrase [Planctomycetota bacterium]
KKLFGHLPAKEFGPLALERVREEMIAQNWCRNYINACVGCIARMFRWAASRELLKWDVYNQLTAVEGLKKNRSAARETAP